MTERPARSSGQIKDSQRVGERIRELVEARGWNFTQLAAAVGVSKAEVSRLVGGAGGAELKDSTLEKYAAALGVSVTYLRLGIVGAADERAIWAAGFERGRQSMLDDALKAIGALREPEKRGASDAEGLDIIARGLATATEEVTAETTRADQASREHGRRRKGRS